MTRRAASMRLPLTLSPHRLRQLWYAPLLALAMALVMVRLLVMARLLDLHAFAAFSAGILVSSTFCMVGCLGLQSVLQREWPAYAMRGQFLRAAVGTAQCNLLAGAIALLFCLGTAAGSLSVAGLGPGLLAMGVLHGAAQQLFLVATTESRSRGDALAYSWQQLTRATLSLTFGASVALLSASPVAVIAAEATVSASLSLVILRGSIVHLPLGWGAIYIAAIRRMSRVQWRSALTMMAVMLVGFAVLNADRWVASHLLEPPRFAQYSFVAILLAAAQALQALINASVYPLLARRFASFGQAVMFRICLRASVATLAVGALASVPVSAALQYSVARWYPQFAEAATLIPLLLAIGVLRVSDFWSSYLLIAGHEHRMLVLNLATVVGAAGVWLAWVTPWNGMPTSLWDIGILAALLTLLGYVATAGTAWSTQRA